MPAGHVARSIDEVHQHAQKLDPLGTADDCRGHRGIRNPAVLDWERRWPPFPGGVDFGLMKTVFIRGLN